MKSVFKNGTSAKVNTKTMNAETMVITGRF
jgi:hypothetical protein